MKPIEADIVVFTRRCMDVLLDHVPIPENTRKLAEVCMSPKAKNFTVSDVKDAAFRIASEIHSELSRLEYSRDLIPDCNGRGFKSEVVTDRDGKIIFAHHIISHP